MENTFNTLIVSAKPNRMGKKRRMAASSEGEQHNGVKACLGGPAHTCLASAWHVLNAPSMFVELNSVAHIGLVYLIMFLLGSWVHLKVMSDLYLENHGDLTFDFELDDTECW